MKLIPGYSHHSGPRGGHLPGVPGGMFSSNSESGTAGHLASWDDGKMERADSAEEGEDREKKKV